MAGERLLTRYKIRNAQGGSAAAHVNDSFVEARRGSSGQRDGEELGLIRGQSYVVGFTVTAAFASVSRWFTVN